MEKYSLIVIGGGPAGLFGALKAAGNGRKILIIEKMPRLGRKLMLSGSGQCNITHREETASFLSHYGDNGRFLKPSLMNFPSRDLISFFTERGLPLMTEPGGKVFPVSRKASDVLNLLVKECTAASVEIRCGDPALDISFQDEGFSIRTGQQTYRADHLAVATGGITYPATGSTGDGYVFAQSLGHRVTEVSPALAAVTIEDYRFQDRAGIAFADVIISLVRAGRKLKQRTGDLLLTHSGLSGPGILDLSRFIRPGDTLRISFLPGIDPQEVEKTLLDRIAAAGNARIRTALAAYHLPERFVNKLLTLAGIDHDLTGAHLSREKRSALIELLTRCPFVVGGLGGVHEAMVTRGGVSLAEINPKTMESRLIPRLYFVGEVLDIDGDTGGYNLQAAFATAALAARKIVERSSEPVHPFGAAVTA
ncbi:MAG: BaiN/RdsA family NAD(P)/FAD-dependent oxidoreductase [Candidatus Aminicenantales bacterium]